MATTPPILIVTFHALAAHSATLCVLSQLLKCPFYHWVVLIDVELRYSVWGLMAPISLVRLCYDG
jgi:hypothetical protein